MDPSNLLHGLYKISWADGSHSLAAVGSDQIGRRWMAPTNWISGPTFDWSNVSKVKLIKASK